MHGRPPVPGYLGPGPTITCISFGASASRCIRAFVTMRASDVHFDRRFKLEFHGSKVTKVEWQESLVEIQS
jgi:hypothetical protein